MKRPTSTIPIVTLTDDVLRTQLVASLARPGGNITGVSIFAPELDSKRLEIALVVGIPEQGHWLAQVVRGYFAYHAVPTNSAAIGAFRHHVVDLWRCSLSRRSQKGGITWQRIKQ